MVTTTTSSPRSLTHQNQSDAPSDWKSEHLIETLPAWVYEKHEAPTSVRDCKAKISKVQHTLLDIDIQIEIKSADISLNQDSAEFTRWHCQALKAKQSHNYVLSAYNYWLILNEPEYVDVAKKFDKLVALLAEDPDDFLPRIKALLD